MDNVVKYGLIMLGIVAIGVLAGILSGVFTNIAAFKFSNDLRKDLYSKIDTVSSYLGMVFHRFIEKDDLTIRIQNRLVKPWNPFFPNVNTKLVDQHEDEFITTKTYLLPSKDELTDDEFNEMNRGDALSHQGFYVYRNNRMIHAGGWLNLKNCKQNHTC